MMINQNTRVFIPEFCKSAKEFRNIRACMLALGASHMPLEGKLSISRICLKRG